MPRSLTLLTLLAALPSPARADAIDGPPACPPGSHGRSSHAGQWCEPSPCATDAECAAHGGGTCRPWRVCTRHASIPPGGRGAFRDPPPPNHEVDVAVASCEPARACRGDEEPPPTTAGTLAPGAPTCTDASYCVLAPFPPLPATAPPPAAPPSPPAAPRAPPPPPAPERSSGGCAVAPSPAGGALALVPLALGALARRRRCAT